MQELLQKQTIMVTTPLMDVTQEYVLSGDFILPEYCPDVAVVLKCLVTPHIPTRRFSGDTLNLDGTAVIRVLYLDEERRCVRAAEFTQPINCTLHGQSGCEGIPVCVNMTADYVNCRAVSPRRIEVRGGFTISACVHGSQPIELPTAAAEERLYTKSIKKTVTAPLSMAEKMIMVNELLAFDSAMPPAEQLLGGDCTAVVSDCKLLSDKAIIKGQMYLHHLYTDDSVSGTTYVLDYTVPFSLIMDADGAKDGLMHTVEVSVLSDTEECVAGVNGPNTALDFSAKLLVQLCIYEQTEATILLDAYHQDCPVSLTKRPLTLRSLGGAFRQTATVQKSIALPSDGLQEILDAWVVPQQIGGRTQDGRTELTAQVLVSMLVRDVDGIIAYYERPEDVTMDCTQAPPCANGMVDATVSIVGVNYAALGDKLDLRMTMAANVALWDIGEEDVLSDIALQKEEPYAKDTAAWRLYYADAGESVWDIARHCHTSPDGICAENDLRDEVLNSKTVLLVPVD